MICLSSFLFFFVWGDRGRILQPAASVSVCVVLTGDRAIRAWLFFVLGYLPIQSVCHYSLVSFLCGGRLGDSSVQRAASVSVCVGLTWDGTVRAHYRFRERRSSSWSRRPAGGSTVTWSPVIIAGSVGLGEVCHEGLEN